MDKKIDPELFKQMKLASTIVVAEQSGKEALLEFAERVADDQGFSIGKNSE